MAASIRFCLKLAVSVSLILISALTTSATTLRFRVERNEDSASASEGSSSFRSSRIYTPLSSDVRRAFWRWQVNIPHGATIQSAYLLLHPEQQINDTPSVMQLALVDDDNCPSLDATTTYDLPVTSGFVDWPIPGDWRPEGGEDGSGWYRSPDIASLVQAYVDRNGYGPNQYLGLRGTHVSGATKIAYQFMDGDVNRGGILEVTIAGGQVHLDVHMADPEVRIAQRIYCEVVNAEPTDTMIATLNGEVVHQKADIAAEEVFVVKYEQLNAGQHELVIRIVSDSGAERAHFSRIWRKTHDGIGVGAINENNALCKHGTPFFPLHSFMLRSDNLESPLAAGFNMLRCVGYYPEHTPNTFNDYLDRAKAVGFPVVGPERSVLGSSHSIAAYIAVNRNHDTLFGWSWKDEPDLGGSSRIPVTEVRDWTDISHSNDTSRPVWVNFSPGGFVGDTEWAMNASKSYTYLHNAVDFGGRRTPVADVIGFDAYPYEYATHYEWITIDDLAKGIQRAREWNRDLLPVVVFIESQDVHASGSDRLGDREWTPGPTPEQLRNLIWLCVIHGAKGIGYFHHFTPTPAENIAVMVEEKARITALTPVILDRERPDLVSVTERDGGRVDATARLTNGNLYVFATNMRDQTERVTFHVPMLGEGAPVNVRDEQRTLATQDGTFEDTLTPFAVRIYTVSVDATVPLPPDDLRFAH